MHIKQLDFVLDCITDGEMRAFETNKITFSHSQIYGINSSDIISKIFWSRKQNDSFIQTGRGC